MHQAKLSRTDFTELPEPLRSQLYWRAKRKREYEKRKAAGLCGYASCPAAARLHRYCAKHLHSMAERHRRVKKQRKKEGLCTYCGTRPHFWGVLCIICHQKFSTNPLPFGARRALRLYCEAEKKFEFELTQAHVRFEISKLLASGSITGDHAKALRLYAGTNVSRNGRLRTYEEVGLLMHLSKERVRQLLKPSKIIIADKLADKVPWRAVQRGNRGDKFPRAYRKLKCEPWRSGSRSSTLKQFPDTNHPNQIASGQ